MSYVRGHQKILLHMKVSMLVFQMTLDGFSTLGDGVLSTKTLDAQASARCADAQSLERVLGPWHVLGSVEKSLLYATYYQRVEKRRWL